ncbi:MAG: hypothetical protein P4L57_11380 [Rhizomicrobium sp.]|nr:hypothetical protein [Rhizomicrobium sp.]
MIRTLMIFALLVFAGFFAGLQLAYDSMNPCRALAVEEARQSVLPTAVAHLWTRSETAPMGPWRCTRGLLRAWRDRLQS